MFIIFVSGVVICSALVAAGTVLWLLWNKSRLVAFCSATLVFMLVCLFFPIPIHGGFNIVAELIFHDIRSEISIFEEQRELELEENFVNSYTQRFSGTVDPVQALDNGGIFDQEKGLIWSGPFTIESPSLDLAKSFCKKLEPKNHWALPEEGEYYQFWKTYGHDARSLDRGRFISYIVQESLRIELPSTYISRKSIPPGQASTNNLATKIHCIARTSIAPQGGYLSTDIELSEWNQFQLMKSR